MDSEAWSGGRRGAGGLGGAAGDSRGRAALCGRLCPRLSVLSPHREGRRAAAFQLKCPFRRGGPAPRTVSVSSGRGLGAHPGLVGCDCASWTRGRAFCTCRLESVDIPETGVWRRDSGGSS